MEYEVKCPSGMVGKVRPIKVKDEALFTDARLLHSGRVIIEIVSRCWESLVNAGPYAFNDGKVDWEKVLQGDVFFLFVYLRRISYGEHYDIMVSCQVCNAAIKEAYDLSQLRLKELDPEALPVVQSGELLKVLAPSGAQLGIRLLRQEDERFIRASQQAHNLPPRFAGLARRIVTIDGVEHVTPRLVAEFVKELSAGEAEELLEACEAHDCGLDTDITLFCGSCGSEQVTTLPLSVSFFRTAARKKEKKTTAEPTESGSGDTSTSSTHSSPSIGVR